jgi:cytochrome c biogenesis protein CcmG, thiol:disulfide interchange protein DsbE
VKRDGAAAPVGDGLRLAGRTAILQPVKGWLKLAALFVVALAATQLLLQRTRPGVAVGERAPGLALPDLAGRPVSLASLHGKVVAVNFWATWCGPCLEEIPTLAEVWRERRGRCFEMLGVAEESGSRDDIAAAAAKLGIPYPVLLDPEGTALAPFKVPGFPRTYLIDADGKVARVFDGALAKGTLEKALEPLLPAACPGA